MPAGCGEDAAVVDRCGDAYPIGDSAKLAFVDGKVDSDYPPSQHEESNLLATECLGAGNDEDGVVDVYLKPLRLQGGRGAEDAKSAPADKSEEDRPA